MSDALLQVDHLKKYFPLKKVINKIDDVVSAVDDVCLEICEGETLGLVGESGSGKTTLAQMILGLLPPTEGSITINGINVTDRRNRSQMKNLIGAVFQDPASSLNPRATIYRSLERPLNVAGITGKDAKDVILETAEKVNLGRELLERFPHELSGGQQQRVSIARAIMLKPKILVLDEPTSALDVSVQAQTLNELLHLQDKYGLTYLFITHNLSVVRYMSDRIAVMYGGKMMEIGETDDIYFNHEHPYTLSLLSSVPPLHPSQRNRKKYLLSGDMPSLIGDDAGCRFASRCVFAKECCKAEAPALKENKDGHFVACHFAGELEF